MSTHLVIPDSHAHYQHDNNRAVWLGQLIHDLRPDVVIHIGDSADMPSLSGYDKGKKSFQGRTYRQDVDTHLDFQERTWEPYRKSHRKLPRRVFCVGNHEHRITRAIEYQPELEGAIGLSDLELPRWYDDVVDYEGGTPGFINIDGIAYAHYFISGVAGRPIGGLHPADSLVSKKHSSATCGHLHMADWSIAKNMYNDWVMGCFVGCYQDYDSDWAGIINKLWWRGIVVKKNVDKGGYDPEFISIDRIKKEYGHLTA